MKVMNISKIGILILLIFVFLATLFYSLNKYFKSDTDKFIPVNVDSGPLENTTNTNTTNTNTTNTNTTSIDTIFRPPIIDGLFLEKDSMAQPAIEYGDINI